MNTFIQLKLTVNVIEHIDQELNTLTAHNAPIDLIRERHNTRELLVKELCKLARQVSVEAVDKYIMLRQSA